MADYRAAISFIQKKEGGISDATTDTAHRNPSPCDFDGDGKPAHTNKGIQWVVFRDNASKLGYSANCANFKEMPDWIWERIYKDQYWDKIKATSLENQAIANFAVEWAWMSGVYGALRQFEKYYDSKGKRLRGWDAVNGQLNKDSRENSQQLLDNLMKFRKDFYISTGQTANLGGWTARLEAFYDENIHYVTENKEKVLLWAALLIVAGGGLLLFSQLRKN